MYLLIELAKRETWMLTQFQQAGNIPSASTAHQSGTIALDQMKHFYVQGIQ